MRRQKKLGINMIEYINEDGVKRGINPFDYGSQYTDIMKTQALKQALNKYGFTAAFGGGRRDEEKNLVQKREFSLSVMRIMHGTRRTRDRRCGNFITPRSTRVRAFVCSPDFQLD